jgi:hypothetical protein
VIPLFGADVTGWQKAQVIGTQRVDERAQCLIRPQLTVKVNDAQPIDPQLSHAILDQPGEFTADRPGLFHFARRAP